MKAATKEEIRDFRTTVRAHFHRHGRSFPWRETKDPYKILVSEVMLQQTQVDRVVPKYKAFLKQFPNVQALAKAPLGDVLRAWSGLGYNRRAKMLHECAKAVVAEHDGKFPGTRTELIGLPGIGPYTAGAVLAFAFNTPEPLIETNVRTTYLFHFFPGKDAVSDRELMPLISATLDTKEPRLWYNALMDYGAWIKKTYGNHGARSKHHTKQSMFKGSVRELRGALLRMLGEKEETTRALIKRSGRTAEEVRLQLAMLEKEKMIEKKRATWHLP